MKRVINTLIILTLAIGLFSCDSFLDVVPEDTATINKAFKMRHQAKKFLYTIYHYLPRYSYKSTKGVKIDPGFAASQETWSPRDPWLGQKLKANLQNSVSPFFNYWEGRGHASPMYEAIRKSNVFLKKIDNVGNMPEKLKKRWAAEVKFLKAYYIFYLTRMYGPIVLNKTNTSVDAPENVIKTTRSPVDSSFSYVIKLLNEVIHTPQLPARITNAQRDLGRITKSIAYSFKCKVAVTAASPLFNGNKLYANFTNTNGVNLFDTKYDPAKWDSAKVACKKAVNYVRAHNYHFYEFTPAAKTENISDTTRLELTIRNSVARSEGRVRPNVIWSNINIQKYHYPTFDRQVLNIPRGLNLNNVTNGIAQGTEGPPLKIVEMFYTNHGLPIDADTSWNYANRYEVSKVDNDEKYYLKKGYKTANLNIDRGPRFYADLAFDGSIWYGNGMYKGGPSEYRYIRAKNGQVNSYPTHENTYFSPTGYWVKKLVNYRSTLKNNGYGASFVWYNWSIMRIADLYLLYAEALNETDGPGPTVYKYLNKVRLHSGVPKVQISWGKWSNNPNKYKTKKGLREIIHRERLIELAFEGKRFWALRRWKELLKYANRPVKGWSRSYSKPKLYYTPKLIYQPHFGIKDYLWPISEKELNRNPNLKQNPNW